MTVRRGSNFVPVADAAFDGDGVMLESCGSDLPRARESQHDGVIPLSKLRGKAR